MSSSETAVWQRLCGVWVAWVAGHAKSVVAGFLILTVLSAYYTASNLSVNTDTEDMLSPDLPFRQNSSALSKAFSQFSDNVVVVVDAPTADQTHDAANLLVSKLKEKADLFGDIFDPATDPFFQKNGLLYLDVDELEKLAERLAMAQPFLGRLNSSPTLPELFRLLEQVLEADPAAEDVVPANTAADIVNKIAGVIDGQLAGTNEILSWRDLLAGEEDQNSKPKRIIVLQPKTNFDSLAPGAEAMEEIRDLAKSLQLKEEFGARVRLTGSLALAQEELESVVEGLGLAGVISLILVVGLLFWALKSVWLLVSTVVTLLCGLILTAGFATLAVGTLNLISIAFAVLFIGLSVDFGIHFCLRYQEQQRAVASKQEALAAAARSNGGALTLTALAAAIGFYAFLPTDYLGLAELGLIAGSGMFIALFTNLTLLPALITILPSSSTQAENTNKGPPFKGLVAARPIIVISGFVVLAVIGLATLPKVGFDFDPLNLRNPNTESVSTLFDLMTDPRQSPYTISILAPNLQEADKIKSRLSSLNSVDGVATASSLVPDKQSEKLDQIGQLALILSPSLVDGSLGQSLPPNALRQSFIALQNRLSADQRNHPVSGPMTDAAARLKLAMSRFQAQTKLDAGSLVNLNRVLLASLPARLTELKLSLEASEIIPKDLPVSLRERMIAGDGRARVDVYPSGDMQSRSELKQFVEEVRTVSPKATGAPVTIFEAGNTVVRAIIEAASVTFILIAALVLLLTRRLRDIILIFIPLFVAAILTTGASGIFGLPFNFANVIVLPLLFGLGIAGNIHLVIREKQTNDPGGVMASSTPRAVIFSSLTTIGSFGSISLSSHPGTASMGVLLTIAIVTSLLCSLVLLPALMTVWKLLEKQGSSS